MEEKEREHQRFEMQLERDLDELDRKYGTSTDYSYSITHHRQTASKTVPSEPPESQAMLYWAGTVRSVNISKKGTVFCDCKEVEQLGILKLNRLKELKYLKGMPTGSFLDELTELYNDLNYLHPFREGNGRTLRLFVTLLVRNTDRDISWSNCDSDLLTIATIKAAQGDLTMLRSVFEEIVSENHTFPS